MRVYLKMKRVHENCPFLQMSYARNNQGARLSHLCLWKLIYLLVNQDSAYHSPLEDLTEALRESQCSPPPLTQCWEGGHVTWKAGSLPGLLQWLLTAGPQRQAWALCPFNLTPLSPYPKCCLKPWYPTICQTLSNSRGSLTFI